MSRTLSPVIVVVFGLRLCRRAIERLSDHGSAYTAKKARDFAGARGLQPCLIPVASPESNGLAEALVELVVLRTLAIRLILGM